MEEIIIKEMELGQFLTNKYSLKETKQYLKNGNIFVNQTRITNFHYYLKKGDMIKIVKHNLLFDILYEDKEVIIVDKPCFLPTIAIHKNDTNNLYYQVSQYVKTNNRKNKIFIVHRLDKDTSGIVILAKNEKAKQFLQENWANFEKKYIAIVEGKVEKQHEILKQYLKETKNHIVYIDKEGSLAITEYRVLKYSNNKTWLDIQIHTGRKNQIRVQLRSINHPIVGDKKYGNKGKRLYLHAYLLKWVHPITHHTILTKTVIPVDFGVWKEGNL